MNFTVEELNWLYFDFDSYFASVEQHLNPDIRNKPLAIVPMVSDYSCAIAASYEAKKYGIKTGTRIYEAKKLCPELICIASNHKVYSEYHYILLEVINNCCYVDHVYSIDEGACKLTGEYKNPKKAIELARKIKKAILNEIGESITCSIGIGSNKFVAKIASNIQKPNGLTLILPEEIKKNLCNLSLKDLPGVGKSTILRLERSNITTVAQLYQIDSMHLEKIWGSVVGKRYWYLMRGIDTFEVKRKTNSLSQSKILLPEEKVSLDSSREVLKKLTLKAAKRLRQKNLFTSKLILSINDISQNKYKLSKKTQPINDNSNLVIYILDLWNILIKNNKIKYVKKISLVFYNLSPDTGQLSLFDIEENHKKKILSNVMDRINIKYKSTVISLGISNIEKKEQEIIAFKKIPKLEK